MDARTLERGVEWSAALGVRRIGRAARGRFNKNCSHVSVAARDASQAPAMLRRRTVRVCRLSRSA
jgi:hypothetical protein